RRLAPPGGGHPARPPRRDDRPPPPDPPCLLLLACHRSEQPDGPFLQSFLRAHARADAGLDRRELAVEALSEEEARALARALLEGVGDPLAPGRAEAVAREA